ncbi:F-actin-capping protein subunit beta, partial [Eschrichtius robustus]|nr:F-actin-capping protein subunit beta [Eschrichtius robustus]
MQRSWAMAVVLGPSSLPPLWSRGRAQAGRVNPSAARSQRQATLDASFMLPCAAREYFEGGVSSVYLWDLDHGFAGVILIKKAGDGSKKIKGCWDSIHVVEVQEKSSGRTAHYKLTSTVMLWLQTNKSGSGTMNLGGSLTRQ